MRTSKATAIRTDLRRTQNIIIKFEPPTGRLIPPTRTNRSLRLSEAPAPPSSLTITSLLSNKVSLSWTDNSNNETGFKIQRKTGATGTYATIATTAANATAYNDITVTDGTVYYYEVSATNAAGDSAFSNEVSGTTPLAAPTSATATAVSSSQINLTWTNNSASATLQLD